MAEYRVIFFDVGNTLLFPNRTKMLAPIANDRHPTLEQWQALERKTKTEFDQSMQSGRSGSRLLVDLSQSPFVGPGRVRRRRDSGVGAKYSRLGELGSDSARDARSYWIESARNFRIAVISNADGKIEKILTRCGIADCFETITDSGIVGYEKPRREIFEAALKTMNARADESLYVGDVYSVDYVGATNAGMQAILFDVAGAYRERPEAACGVRGGSSRSGCISNVAVKSFASCSTLQS